MDPTVTAEMSKFMSAYTLRAQHGPDRAMTRYKYDMCKMVENNEITTGPGRYALGVPNAYGDAAFAPNPTVRMQKWGAAHDMASTKTDVESDLLNLRRPLTRVACGPHASPADVAARHLTAMPEVDFPQTAARLVDPPCTLRDSGINRWQWLGQNPQENVMMPFEWAVDSRYASKDAYVPTIAKPLATSSAAASHCVRLDRDAGVPVPRIPGPRDPPNFTNQLASDALGVAPVHVTRVYPPPTRSGIPNPHAPPGPGYVEMERATTGILAPPPPFTA